MAKLMAGFIRLQNHLINEKQWNNANVFKALAKVRTRKKTLTTKHRVQKVK